MKSVGAVTRDGAWLEARVWVEFDPAATNPIVMEAALAGAGFTVLSAVEAPPRHTTGVVYR